MENQITNRGEIMELGHINERIFTTKELAMKSLKWYTARGYRANYFFDEQTSEHTIMIIRLQGCK